MPEKEVVLHTRFRFKPEGSDKYITAFFESSATDVLVKTPFMDIYDGNGTLKDLLDAIEQNMTKSTLMLTATEFQAQNPILQKGQFGFEIDTGILKLGDGMTNYNNLKFTFTTKPVDLNTLNLEGFNEVNDNEVVGTVDDNNNVKSAKLEFSDETGKNIAVDVGDLNIGTEGYHSSNIFFEVKEPPLNE